MLELNKKQNKVINSPKKILVPLISAASILDLSFLLFTNNKKINSLSNIENNSSYIK